MTALQYSFLVFFLCTSITLLCIHSKGSQSKTQRLLETSVSNDLQEPEETKLDFAIIGFPKCSTTFLRNGLFASSRKIFLGNDDNEIHYLHHNQVSRFKELFKNHSNTINGFKCPDLLYSDIGLNNLDTFFHKTDLIITIRHPILWFQSFYNYRVRNGYKMPEPHLLIGSCATAFDDSLDKYDAVVKTEAHKVCTDRARFHIAMSRLGKTPMNTTGEMKLLNYQLLPIHNLSNKIFLMEIGQLSVNNQTIADQFVTDLEIFLNLRRENYENNDQSALPRLTNHTPRHYIDPKLNIEEVSSNIIDICDSNYDDLRKILLNIGSDASRWIVEYFIKSESVYVSQREVFKELLLKWTEDPCGKDDDDNDDVDSVNVS